MAQHTIELRPYQAKVRRSRGAFTVDVKHQRQILVDGVFVGYCPTTRQPIPLVGMVPAEIREAVEKSAESFWNDGGGAAKAVQAPVIGQEDNDE